MGCENSQNFHSLHDTIYQKVGCIFVCLFVCFARAAITKFCMMSGLKQHKFIALWLWRAEVWNQGVKHGWFFLEALKKSAAVFAFGEFH